MSSSLGEEVRNLPYREGLVLHNGPQFIAEFLHYYGLCEKETITVGHFWKMVFSEARTTICKFFK